MDKVFDFGQLGDIAVVGDFDGDGIDEVAIVRGNRLIVDSNRNQSLDANDRVIELESDTDEIVIGDFDGDGKDEPATIRRGKRVSNEVARKPVKRAKLALVLGTSLPILLPRMFTRLRMPLQLSILVISIASSLLGVCAMVSFG